ncbi:hypothetical protein BCR33DRAFT_219551 [Rhizoclosmatium globosum]|uniref:Uncharacterized protein n=1 Tax=Rhizoclosmatium globosum TaxID=329046 RepID=A0A1Y2CBY0_9FUNG|nr:hypothetical protein BCR33DRAFT_219551 [Rhizoclosmatium globosum]|eukprot:ORY44354.1 hypothetical protein BCR33DRAFT_219551 [Rhizoclosmatium globosum]
MRFAHLLFFLWTERRVRYSNVVQKARTICTGAVKASASASASAGSSNTTASNSNSGDPPQLALSHPRTSRRCPIRHQRPCPYHRKLLRYILQRKQRLRNRMGLRNQTNKRHNPNPNLRPKHHPRLPQRRALWNHWRRSVTDPWIRRSPLLRVYPETQDSGRRR